MLILSARTNLAGQESTKAGAVPPCTPSRPVRFRPTVDANAHRPTACKKGVTVLAWSRDDSDPVTVPRHARGPWLGRAIDAVAIQAHRSWDGSYVAFENARAFWFDGVPAGTAEDLDSLRQHATSSRSVAWAELVELRIEARADDRVLKASHRNGDSWSVPLRPDQIVMEE